MVACTAQKLAQGPFSSPRRAKQEEGAERLIVRRDQLFGCHNKPQRRRFSRENAREILQDTYDQQDKSC